MDTDELHHTIPATDAKDSELQRDVHYIKQQLALVIQALGAEQLRAPGSPDGMMQTLSRHEERIKELESKREAIKLVAMNILTAILGGAATAWIVLHLIH